jgi:hypothetical protein
LRLNQPRFISRTKRASPFESDVGYGLGGFSGFGYVGVSLTFTIVPSVLMNAMSSGMSVFPIQKLRRPSFG